MKRTVLNLTENQGYLLNDNKPPWVNRPTTSINTVFPSSGATQRKEAS